MPTRTEAITLPRGDTWLNTLPITERDGTPYDLTDATLWLTIKAASDTGDDDAAAPVQLTLGAGLTVPDPPTGIVTVEIADDATDTLVVGRRYTYDVQVRKAGKTFTPIGGPVTVAGDVTRS